MGKSKKKNKVVKKRIVIRPSWSDGQKLLTHARSKRDLLLMRLCLYQALREGEILGSSYPIHGILKPLTFDDVDLERKVILIHGKGDSIEEVFLEDLITFQLMKDYIERNKKKKFKSFSNQIFHLSTRHFQRLVKQAAIDAKIENAERFSPHTLRALSITYYNTKTGNLSRAQHHARHKSIKTTTLYDRPDSQTRREEESKVFDEGDDKRTDEESSTD